MERSDLKDTELRLGPPGSADEPDHVSRRCKRPTPEMTSDEFHPSERDTTQEPEPAAYKSQVVGWPPIQAYRKSSFQLRKSEANSAAAGIYVKVSMDGAPYLRKIDLKLYKGYEELREALEDMFKCFSLGSSRAVAYEDKDGDLMLVGDVPWRMFISSCKKLRIMRRSEATDLKSVCLVC